MMPNIDSVMSDGNVKEQCLIDLSVCCFSSVDIWLSHLKIPSKIAKDM